MSKFSELLAALLHVDDTCLYVLNSDSHITTEVVVKVQCLLNAWHNALKYTERDLKLAKCYWNLQAYLWQDGVYTCIATTSGTIKITNNNSKPTIKHIPVDSMRMLVGVPIMPSNESKDIVLFMKIR